MINVFDVVGYILFKIKSTTAMKLQKLVYYCQAWSLVWDEKPLFKENIEAWANGPVVRELYRCYKGLFEISNCPKGDKSKLNSEQKETIDAVLDYYGNKSPQWLGDLTHIEDPWRNARNGIIEGKRGSRVITLASMEEYYSSLDKDS